MIQIWLGVVSSRLQSDEEYMDHLLIDDSSDNKRSVHRALASHARSSRGICKPSLSVLAVTIAVALQIYSDHDTRMPRSKSITRH